MALSRPPLSRAAMKIDELLGDQEEIGYGSISREKRRFIDHSFSPFPAQHHLSVSGFFFFARERDGKQRDAWLLKRGGVSWRGQFVAECQRGCFYFRVRPRARELSFSSASSNPRVSLPTLLSLSLFLLLSTCSYFSTAFAHRRRGWPRGPWIRALAGGLSRISRPVSCFALISVAYVFCSPNVNTASGRVFSFCDLSRGVGERLFEKKKKGWTPAWNCSCLITRPFLWQATVAYTRKLRRKRITHEMRSRWHNVEKIRRAMVTNAE